MTSKSPLLSICAGPAIAAALALSSTGLQAQETTPAPDIPVQNAEPGAATAPTQTTTTSAQETVQPPTTPSVVLPPDALIAVPQSSIPKSDASKPAIKTARAIPREMQASAPNPAKRPVQNTVAQTPAGQASPTVIVPNEPLPPDPASMADTAPPPVQVTSNEDRTAAIAASLVGLAVLGGIGAAYAAARRRRSRDYDESYQELEPESIEPDAAEPVSAPVMPEPAFAAAPATPGAPAILTSSDDREAVIAAMVAAPPDAENPYTSAAKRRRKARMILAAREQQQAATASAFDFRNYRPSGTTMVKDVDTIEA